MRLAGYLGKSISWVEDLPEIELRKWMAWYKIEPFGEERMDLRFALMTAHVVSPYLKKGHKPKLSDYMMEFQPKPKMSNDEIRKVLERIANGQRRNHIC